MALPDDLTPTAARIHKRLRPIAVGEEEHGYTVAALAAAMALPLDELNAVVRGTDTYEPWEPAVNPAIAPPWLLPWLGAIVGAPVGKPRAGQTVEQWAADTTGPWDDTLVITAARCPSQPTTTAAALAEKPIMRRWTIVFSDPPIMDQAGAARTIDSVGAAVTLDNAVVADVS
jgi:hypothetical protein